MAWQEETPGKTPQLSRAGCKTEFRKGAIFLIGSHFVTSNIGVYYGYLN